MGSIIVELHNFTSHSIIYTYPFKSYCEVNVSKVKKLLPNWVIIPFKKKHLHYKNHWQWLQSLFTIYQSMIIHLHTNIFTLTHMHIHSTCTRIGSVYKSKYFLTETLMFYANAEEFWRSIWHKFWQAQIRKEQ